MDAQRGTHRAKCEIRACYSGLARGVRRRTYVDAAEVVVLLAGWVEFNNSDQARAGREGGRGFLAQRQPPDSPSHCRGPDALGARLHASASHICQELELELELEWAVRPDVCGGPTRERS